MPHAFLSARLPHAPSMKVYCVYGHGKATEVRPRLPGWPWPLLYSLLRDRLTLISAIQRSYWYTQQASESDEITPDDDPPAPLCTEESPGSGANCTSPRPPLDMPPLARATYSIDAEYTDEAANPPVVNGVKMGEGDGTVSLLSLGAMCVEGWKRPRWNPAGVTVTTVEVRLASFRWAAVAIRERADVCSSVAWSGCID